MLLSTRSMLALIVIGAAAYAVPTESADAPPSTGAVAAPPGSIQLPGVEDGRARSQTRFQTAGHTPPRSASMSRSLWAGGSNDVTWGPTAHFAATIVMGEGTIVVSYSRLANMYCTVVFYPVCVVLTHELVRGMVEAWFKEGKHGH